MNLSPPLIFLVFRTYTYTKQPDEFLEAFSSYDSAKEYVAENCFGQKLVIKEVPVKA